MTDPKDAEIARLTRERDEALRADRDAIAVAAFEMAARVAEGWGNCARDDDMAREIRALTPVDATAALNRVRAGAMREAAGINVARTGRDWVAGSLWDRIAQDHRSAILARADAVERGE